MITKCKTCWGTGKYRTPIDVGWEVGYCPVCSGRGYYDDNDGIKISNFRDQQGKQKKAGEPSQKNVVSRKREAPVNQEDEDQDPIKKPKPRRKKRFDAAELLKKFEDAQLEAERTGKEVEVWDDYGFVGAVFPKEKSLQIPDSGLV